jgi:hypothetical protein
MRAQLIEIFRILFEFSLARQNACGIEVFASAPRTVRSTGGANVQPPQKSSESDPQAAIKQRSPVRKSTMHPSVRRTLDSGDQVCKVTAGPFARNGCRVPAPLWRAYETLESQMCSGNRQSHISPGYHARAPGI